MEREVIRMDFLKKDLIILSVENTFTLCFDFFF